MVAPLERFRFDLLPSPGALVAGSEHGIGSEIREALSLSHF